MALGGETVGDAGSASRAEAANPVGGSGPFGQRSIVVAVAFAGPARPGLGHAAGGASAGAALTETGSPPQHGSGATERTAPAHALEFDLVRHRGTDDVRSSVRIAGQGPHLQGRHAGP